jgi:hypothetical protein
MFNSAQTSDSSKTKKEKALKRAQTSRNLRFTRAKVKYENQ